MSVSEPSLRAMAITPLRTCSRIDDVSGNIPEGKGDLIRAAEYFRVCGHYLCRSYNAIDLSL